jgi:hypothetical protein
MGEINVIFGGNLSLTSKMQGKKLQRKISLAQRIEPGRTMRWSDVDISFRPEDHLEAELSDRNLPFVIKISIGCHKVAKTLINSGASLNIRLHHDTGVPMSSPQLPFSFTQPEATVWSTACHLHIALDCCCYRRTAGLMLGPGSIPTSSGNTSSAVTRHVHT